MAGDIPNGEPLKPGDADTATKQEGEQPPPKVLLPPAETNPPPAPNDKGKSHRPDRDWLDYVKFAVEVVGLGFLITYTVYAGLQWRAIKKSNKISHYSMEVSQRAFVFIPGIFEENSGTDARSGTKLGVFTFHLENSGNTPATVTGTFINTNYYKTPGFKWDKLPDDFAFPDNPPTGAFANSALTSGTLILAPHDIQNFQIAGIPESVFPLVNKGTAHVYFWGWISYADIFGCHHKTEFARELTAIQPAGPNGQLRFYIDNLSRHNCIDGDCADYQKDKDQSCNDTKPKTP